MMMFRLWQNALLEKVSAAQLLPSASARTSVWNAPSPEVGAPRRDCSYWDIGLLQSHPCGSGKPPRLGVSSVFSHTWCRVSSLVTVCTEAFLDLRHSSPTVVKCASVCFSQEW